MHLTACTLLQILTSTVGESEARLRDAFGGARSFVTGTAPRPEGARPPLALIFLDEVDALCKARDAHTARSPVHSRVVAQLATLLDSLATVRQAPTDGYIVVIGATNLPHAIDMSFRRAGRFDREVRCLVALVWWFCSPLSRPSLPTACLSRFLATAQIRIDPPNPAARLEILRLYCSKLVLDAALRQALPYLAAKLVGYVGADIAALCREAALLTLPAASADSTASAADVTPLRWEHFEAALAKVGAPSSLRGIAPSSMPRTAWDDVGGLLAAKSKMKQAVEWPLLHPAAFKRMGLTPPRGILLHGPPGCAKTTLVRAAAAATGAAFIVLSGADVYSPYVGDAEKALRCVLGLRGCGARVLRCAPLCRQAFITARAAPPAIIFLDEVDAMVGRRGIAAGATDAHSVSTSVLATLLNEMDGVEWAEGVLVVAATNRVDMLDPALLRPGRFDLQLKIDLPTRDERADVRFPSRCVPLAPRVSLVILCLACVQILRVRCRDIPVDSSVHFDALADATDGWSGAELESLCRESALAALRADIGSTSVSSEHFAACLRTRASRTAPVEA